jgi:hypothetical protein
VCPSPERVAHSEVVCAVVDASHAVRVQGEPDVLHASDPVSVEHPVPRRAVYEELVQDRVRLVRQVKHGATPAPVS